MSPAGKRGVIIGGVVVMVAIVVAGVLVLHGSASPPNPPPLDAAATQITAPDPATAAQDYLRAFAAGDIDQASALTDDTTAAASVLHDAWTTLHPTEVDARLGKVGAATGTKVAATYTVNWTIEGHVWSYNDTLDVVKIDGGWLVHWAPSVLQPTLQAGQRLGIYANTPDQNAVLDRDGKPLVTYKSGTASLVDPADFGSLQSELYSRVQAASRVFAIERVDAAHHNLQTLFGSTSVQTKPSMATLSTAVQAAAQSTVNSYSGRAMIVAIQPSTGGILAVARNAQESDTSPFSGLFPPGSTFKIVTATAAIENGLSNEDSVLQCPGTALVGTRTISNEDFALGTTTMHHAFARSCNTTFAQLASQLPGSGLATAAEQFGLEADFDIPGLTTQTGAIKPPSDHDQQVEDGIGQGNVQVSPFGEALMAATVAEGHAVTPQLWRDDATTVNTGYTAPPSAVVAQLRSMMREVVTDGTATGLAGSGLVYGKTGTAQFGTGEQAHGWFTGYRGDMAFVVFLEGANSSTPAVTLAAKFLAQVH